MVSWRNCVPCNMPTCFVRATSWPKYSSDSFMRMHMQPGSACHLGVGDLDISGPHCSDHSQRGHQMGRRGSTCKYFLVHCQELRQRQVKVAILENVPTGEFGKLVYLGRVLDIRSPVADCLVYTAAVELRETAIYTVVRSAMRALWASNPPPQKKIPYIYADSLICYVLQTRQYTSSHKDSRGKPTPSPVRWNRENKTRTRMHPSTERRQGGTTPPLACLVDSKKKRKRSSVSCSILGGVCVCMYVCMYVCMHACMYVLIHIYICLHVYIYIYVHVALPERTYIQVWRYKISLCVHICIYTHIPLF